MRKCLPILLLAFAACQQPAKERTQPVAAPTKKAQGITATALAIADQASIPGNTPIESKKKQTVTQPQPRIVQLPPLAKAAPSKRGKPGSTAVHKASPNAVAEPAPVSSGGAVYEEDYIPFIKQFW